MPINFLQIPVDLRTPGTYIEFDNSMALGGLVGLHHKLLFIGQRLGTGATAAEVLTRVVSANDADQQFGYGSMLARMIKAAKVQNPYTEMWAVALDDAAAGVAATGTLTFTGPATAAGTVCLLIGGVRVRFAVAKDDAAADIATAAAAAVNAATELPVTAAAVDAVVTLTYRHKGEVGNHLDLRHSYYLGEKLPTGVGLAIVAMANGSANPEVADAIAALADQQFQHIVMPYTDAANLTAMEEELEDRWGPLRQIEGHCYTAAAGTSSTLGTLGNTRNTQWVTIMGAGKSPTPVEVWASVVGATAAYHLNIDPARPLQTLHLQGILAPSPTERFDQSERNTLLWDGISTYKMDSSDRVLLDRVITTYQTNAQGVEDPSYLDVNTMATLSYIREQVRYRISQRYARHKLADDDARVGPGQTVARPKDVRAELVALFSELERNGIVENLDQFEQDLIVERNASDHNRLDALIPPDLVGQFRLLAGQIQYRL